MPFSDFLQIDIDKVLHDVPVPIQRVVACCVFIASLQIFCLGAMPDMFDDMIDCIFLRLDSFIFALLWLIVAFSRGLTENYDNYSLLSSSTLSP